MDTHTNTLVERKRNLMFDCCEIKKGTCPFAAKSTYDPEHESNLWEEYTFCGAMGGADTRVKHLSECWLDMSNGQRRKHVKKINAVTMTKRGYQYDKARKRWVRL